MPTGFKMVRIPDDLAERITATGQKREPFVREAVEAALSGSPNGASPPPERAPEPSPAPAGAREAAPPRAVAKSAPVNHAMERQRKLNDAKYGRRS